MCSLWSLDENRKEASSVEMKPCEPQVPHHKEDPSAGAVVPQETQETTKVGRKIQQT